MVWSDWLTECVDRRVELGCQTAALLKRSTKGLKQTVQSVESPSKKLVTYEETAVLPAVCTVCYPKVPVSYPLSFKCERLSWRTPTQKRVRVDHISRKVLVHAGTNMLSSSRNCRERHMR